jgi:DNA invertase Pin-like site-specific DNA recombinase
MDQTASPTRAAQYVRMSTDHQRYSIEDQSRVIADYAAARGYEIVRTYADAGRSGLSLKGRPALSKLLADVVAGDIDFATVLVLDVSRWGRFQDLDEAAHYEFICRSSDVAIQYCAETFENDGSIYAAIVKQLKRVMAAEYSRELSVKVARVLRALAAQGYRMSGTPGYGLRRLILDEQGYPGVTLELGQRKAVRSHRIMLVPGPPEEVAVVRRIYHLKVARGWSMVAIAKALNAEGLTNQFGRPWGTKAIRTVLTNEKYIGNNTFGHLTKRLGGKATRNPPEAWVRVEDAFPGIIARKLFLQARRATPRKKIHLNEEELLQALRDLWRTKGMLSFAVINSCTTMPTARTYIHRFGGLTAAYRLIGYDHRLALRLRLRSLSDAEMLERLADLLARRGKLTHQIIKGDPGVPSPSNYGARFGSLFAAYERVGYLPPYPSEPRRRLARKYSDVGMLEGLRALYEREGMLSLRLIDADPAIPGYNNYLRRFGNIRDLYGHLGVGYHPRQMASRMRGADGRLLSRQDSATV